MSRHWTRNVHGRIGGSREGPRRPPGSGPAASGTIPPTSLGCPRSRASRARRTTSSGASPLRYITSDRVAWHLTTQAREACESSSTLTIAPLQPVCPSGAAKRATSTNVQLLRLQSSYGKLADALRDRGPHRVSPRRRRSRTSAKVRVRRPGSRSRVSGRGSRGASGGSSRPTSVCGTGCRPGAGWPGSGRSRSATDRPPGVARLG